ncbi:MAG: H-type lectin domain-containing protein [Pseudomonadota bacterium]
MRRYSSNAIGVDQGDRVLFSDFIDGGPMWTGDGPREFRFSVKFSEAYLHPPQVHLSMSMWDSDHKSNQRMDLSAEDISLDGFVLVFKTWGDSRIARVRANWMAIGPVSHEDDWQLY